MRTSGKEKYGWYTPPKHKDETAIKEELQKEANDEVTKRQPQIHPDKASAKPSEIESDNKIKDQHTNQDQSNTSEVT